jgi:hypothetical protein
LKSKSSARSKRTAQLSHVESEPQKRFFFNRSREGRNEDFTLPDAVSRLSLINIEAAQNQFDLESQLKTNKILNSKFSISFKRNNSNLKLSEGMNESISNIKFFIAQPHSQSYANFPYKLKRHIPQSPYSKQQNIIHRYGLSKDKK